MIIRIIKIRQKFAYGLPMLTPHKLEIEDLRKQEKARESARKRSKSNEPVKRGVKLSIDLLGVIPSRGVRTKVCFYEYAEIR